MVSLGSPLLYCAPTQHYSQEELSSLDPSRSPSIESFSSVLTTESIESELWVNMSLNSQLRAFSDLKLDGLERVSKHPAYYIPGGDVVFCVESTLFRVHRYFFYRESPKFRELLNSVALTNPDRMPAGTSDAHPVPLTDVTKEEFESFLWVFYNEDYFYEAPLERWTAILRLAHLWTFKKVKELAMQEMNKLRIAPVNKVIMARKYEVDPKYRWLEQAFAVLGTREAPISKVEGEKLGLDDVLRLAELREKIRKRRFEGRTASSYDGDSDVQDEASPVIRAAEPYFCTANAYNNNYNNNYGHGAYGASSNYPGAAVPMNYGGESWGRAPHWPSWNAPVRVPTPPTPPQPIVRFGSRMPGMPTVVGGPPVPPPASAAVVVRPPTVPPLKMEEEITVSKRDFGCVTVDTEEPDVIDFSSYSEDDVADVRTVFGL